MVYVISKDGKPLMPTKRHGRVRILLKEKKARVVQRKPFTIQLLYDSTTYVQDITAGFDIGRAYQSITAVNTQTGEVLYSSVLETRNKEVPKLMKSRKMYRAIRRHNRRMKKVRRAVRDKTYFRTPKKVVWPGAKEPITAKHIKPKEARFNNRKRPEGWLTPTAVQLLRSHLNYLEKVRRILPIKTMVLEYGKFDIQKLENPDIRGSEYQHGKLYGYNNLREYVKTVQQGKCLLCGKRPIEHLHHVMPGSKEGSDTYKNIAGLCSKCHAKVHTSPKAKEKLAEKAAGTAKEYADTSILNIIMPYLYSELKSMLGTENIALCYGYETEAARKSFGLAKSHSNDSYAMALMAIGQASRIEKIEPYRYKQYRRHNRAFCDAQRDRLYKKDGKIAARNRRRRTEQEGISLAEYRSELITALGKKIATREISKLKVYRAVKKKSTSIKDVLFPPGCAVNYKGQRAVVKSFFNKGSSLILEGISGYVPAKDCQLITKKAGIVCL
jgi:5-methylcytosine-specific restriction endonuclease McrA